MFGLTIPFYSPLLTGNYYCNYLKKKWPAAIAAANLHSEITNRKIRVPRLSNVHISDHTGYEIQALVDTSTVGHTTRELNSRIETVAASLRAYSIRVEKITPSQSRITVLFRRPPTPIHRATQELDLENFPIRLDPTDDAPTINLTTSILIGGASESGKSNLVWYILSQLNDYGIPYQLYVIDPAGGVELSDLENSPQTRYYVDRVANIPDIVQKFRTSMDDRLSSMKRRGVRRHFPTVSEPLKILIIDELLLCKSQLNGGDAASPIGEILASGRKALHITISCSQLGQKDVIGQIRDLYPQRICLRTRTYESTDAVLGSNATQDGANCHRITNRGEGYVFTDTSGVFEKFRAPHVTNTRTVAQGGTTAPEIPATARTIRRRSRPHFTYKLYDDPQLSRPCYVGIADNPRRRLKQHEKDWPTEIWRSIIHSRTVITQYPNWDAAKAMETALIDYWAPKYNIQERTR